MIKVIKPFKSIGDTWPEVFGNLLIMVLIAPIYLLFFAIYFPLSAIDWLFQPRNLKTPPVVKDDTLPGEEKVKLYLQEIQKHKDLGLEKIREMDSGVTFKNNKTRIEIWRHDDCVGINLSRVDSGMWHTDEEGNIDLYFWLAVGAAREGMIMTKSIFGNKQAWIHSKEMNCWLKCSAQDGSYSYVDTRRNGPRWRIVSRR